MKKLLFFLKKILFRNGKKKASNSSIYPLR
jgi:hypothetical protein